MIINEIKGNLRCDMPLCKNKAEFLLTKSGASTNNGIRICSECAREIKKTLSNAFGSKDE